MTYVRIFMMLGTALLTLWASPNYASAGWIGAFASEVWIYANAIALQEQVGVQ